MHVYDSPMTSKQEQIEEQDIEAAYEVKRQLEAVIYWNARENFCGEASQPTLKLWANLSHWTLAEATALTINRDPEKLIDPAVGKGLLGDAPNINQYKYVQEHTKRAVQAGELTDPVQLGVYVAWAQKRDLDFPEELAKLVPAAAADNQNEKSNKAKKPADKNQTALMRERNTLLKLFFCAAVDGYGYDPKAERSPTAKEMESAFERLGIRISDDTIRKYLNEAKEHLPADFQDD